MEDEDLLLGGGDHAAAGTVEQHGAPAAAEETDVASPANVPPTGGEEATTSATGPQSAPSAVHTIDPDDLAALLDQDSVAPPPGAYAAREDDASAPHVDDNGAGESSDYQQQHRAVTPPRYDPTEGLSVAELFSEFFSVPGEFAPVVDPELAVIATVAEHLFGPGFQWRTSAPAMQPPQLIAQEIRDGLDRHLAFEIFGPGFDLATKDNLFCERPPDFITAVRPADSFAAFRSQKLHDGTVGTHMSQVWLFDMPTTGANRQTLHVDPFPFRPELGVKPDNTPRALHTPLNTIRWAYDITRDRKLSNSRLVLWSDGSATLHTGSDVYEIHDNVQRELHMVGDVKPSIVHTTEGDREAFFRLGSDSSTCDGPRARLASEFCENIPRGVGENKPCHT